MFTGIVKELGSVASLLRNGRIYKLKILCDYCSERSSIGDSVAVNGVCLTITGKSDKFLRFDVMEETVKKTTLSAIKDCDRVNLELAIKPSESLGGHFVLGHIDCIGSVSKIDKGGDNCSIAIAYPKEYRHLVVEKGSIAIDGISLTVGSIGYDTICVYVIPHTLKSTNLGGLKIGDRLNLEFDIIGKYVYNMNKLSDSGITEEFLKKHGF